MFRPNRNPLKTVNPKGVMPKAIPCCALTRSVSTRGDCPSQQEAQAEVSHTHALVDTVGAHRCARRYSQRPAKAGIRTALNYGMKENKLARQIKKPVQEAKKILDGYMKTYPAVGYFYEASIAQARELGCTFTVLGRRRKLPAITSSSTMDRWRAERQAVNTEIQGSAADVCKMAMLRCDDAQLEGMYGCYMNLQVHDELVFEVEEAAADEVLPVVRELMEHPFPEDLAVALEVSISHGENWAKAK